MKKRLHWASVVRGVLNCCETILGLIERRTGIKITRKHSKGMVSGHKLLTFFISLNLQFRFLQSVMIGVKRDALGKKKFSLCEVSKKK